MTEGLMRIAVDFIAPFGADYSLTLIIIYQIKEKFKYFQKILEFSVLKLEINKILRVKAGSVISEDEYGKENDYIYQVPQKYGLVYELSHRPF